MDSGQRAAREWVAARDRFGIGPTEAPGLAAHQQDGDSHGWRIVCRALPLSRGDDHRALAADGALRGSCWSGDAGAGMLSMALNPTEAPCELECVTETPVSTGSFRQDGNVLHLGPWSAVTW